MRAFTGLSALAAALVGGCGSAQADREANRPVAPAGAAEAPVQASEPPPPPTPPPAPPATGKTIPANLLGTYDASIQDCGRPSDGRLTVSATELRFHESLGTVREVTAAGADSVRVEADYQGEGERWRNTHELRRADGGASLTVSGDGTSFTRVRCPAEAR